MTFMKKGRARRNGRARRARRQNPGSVMHPKVNPVPYVAPRTTITKVRLSDAPNYLSTDASGHFYHNIPLDATTTTEWTNYIGLYEEYRIIGALLTMVPNVPFVSSVANGIIFVAFDPVVSYTPSSASQLLAYSNRAEYQVLSYDRAPLRYGCKYPVAGAETALLWHNVTTPPVLGCILIAADDLLASTAYFNYFVDYYVEFRSRA